MLGQSGIMVVGGACARFIGVEIPEDTTLGGGPRLVEHADLINPDVEVPARGLFSDRSGRAHAAGVGAAHGLDDHREQHQAEIERRFTRRVLDAAQTFVAERRLTRLLVAAECQLLGRLRAALDPKRWRGVEIVELREDLSRHSLRQLHHALARHGLLRRAEPPAAGFYRPRGQAPSFR